MNDHLLCHSERRDFSCTICGTLFKAIASLKRHMKKHHNKMEQENGERESVVMSEVNEVRDAILAPIITEEVISDVIVL